MDYRQKRIQEGEKRKKKKWKKKKKKKEKNNRTQKEKKKKEGERGERRCVEEVRCERGGEEEEKEGDTGKIIRIWGVSSSRGRIARPISAPGCPIPTAR